MNPVLVLHQSLQPQQRQRSRYVRGLVSMTGTFIDTIIICTMTGLSIVLTGAWQQEGLEGVQVTTYAFQEGLPISEQVAAFLLMLCLVFFAFTTILGWDYYSSAVWNTCQARTRKQSLYIAGCISWQYSSDHT